MNEESDESEQEAKKEYKKEHEEQKQQREQQIDAHWIFIRLNETAIKPHFLRLSPGEHGIGVVLELDSDNGSRGFFVGAAGSFLSFISYIKGRSMSDAKHNI